MTTKPQSTTEETLESCPFCGANAFISWDGDVNSPDDWSANCDNTLDCGATVGGICSEDAARKAWNTRTPPSTAPVVDNNVGVWFKAAVSGLWYTNHESAGDIAAVRVNGVRFNPAPESLCVCGHTRKVHESYSDHDECLGCIKERNGLTEERCSWFTAAATAAPVAQRLAESPPPLPAVTLAS